MYHVRSFFNSTRLAGTLQKGLTTLCMFLTSLTLSSCSSQLNGALTSRHYDAFTYMQVETNVVVAYGCINEPGERCTFIAAQPHKSNASGIVVMNSKTRRGRQYVMTAAHVCESVVGYEARLKSAWLKQSNFIVDRFMYTSTIKIKNSSGNTYDGKVIALWPDRDLCVVAVEGMKIIPVKVAEEQVKMGDKIWNLAAPLGIWQEDLQNKFEGYYAGTYVCNEETRHTFPIKCKLGEKTWTVFDVPAAPGSSGSPIFNGRGELIGIISMVPNTFPEIAYASRLEDIRLILLAARKWDQENEDIDFNSDELKHPRIIEL